jgi:hypothetical protein
MPKLYQLTLQRSSSVTHAVYGNFSAAKAQEIIVSRYKTIELLRPDDSGKVQSVLSQEIFGVIRAVQPFRLTGASRDYIVVASDSGRIVILEYDGQKNIFEKVHQNFWEDRVPQDRAWPVSGCGSQGARSNDWGYREAKVCLHSQSGFCGPSNNFIAPGGSQELHPCLRNGGHGRGL